MKASNADIERAEQRVENERAIMIARAQSQLIGSDATDCMDCGDPIEPARKRALPSARRCVWCQEKKERI